MLYLNPESHTYYDDQNNIYTSVTTYLGELFPFDQNKIIKEITNNPKSKYYKQSKQQILEHWQERAALGTALHKACEDYIKVKKMPDTPEFVPLVKQFAKLAFNGRLYSEYIVGDKDYLLAGTIDILEEEPNKIWIWDIKTNTNLDEDKLMKYSIQLELYRVFTSKTRDKPTQVGGIIYFEDLYFKKEKTRLKVLPVLNVKHVVQEILEERKEKINLLKKSLIFL